MINIRLIPYQHWVDLQIAGGCNLGIPKGVFNPPPAESNPIPIVWHPDMTPPKKQRDLSKYECTTMTVTLNRIEMLGGFLIWERRDDGTVEIRDIHVDNEYRRKGIGRKMLEVLFRQLDGATRVWAITRAENQVAQQFYERCCFRDVSILRRFYNDKTLDAIMFVRCAGGPV